MSKVNVLIQTGYGLNCDLETAHAFTLAGASPARIHINSLVDRSVRLDSYQILVFGGGFSWGDDHGAGVIHAVRLKTHIGGQLLEFIDKGKLVIGICNGFQTLVNLGLLPGLDGDYRQRSVALTFNDCGNFRDQWVSLQADPDSPCVFTKGMGALELPVRHGEGKFYAEPAIISRLEKNHQVALRYCLPDGSPANGSFPHNPNGSVHDIAGICDPTGRIFGLMPHPEAYHHFTNHPDWTRIREVNRRKGITEAPGVTPGIRILENAVNFIRSR
jgi:phosphoribosylformylglycinamidine synthase subunit PurQ / glutaminase